MAKNIRKINGRDRSRYRIRKKIVGTDQRPRISIFRSSKHMYAQLISDVTGVTLASAASNDKDVVAALGDIKAEDATSESRSTKSTATARAVGVVLAKRALDKNLKKAIFDRSGYVYAGRVKALAEGVRAGGVEV